MRERGGRGSKGERRRGREGEEGREARLSSPDLHPYTLADTKTVVRAPTFGVQTQSYLPTFAPISLPLS